MSAIRRWLYEPRVRGVNVDDASLLEIHSAILREKALLRSAFETFYGDMADCCDRFFLVEGQEIELGTGAGFFKTRRPHLVTSDVRRSPNIDIELDAQAMALPSETVRCIYAINVFHHLAQPERFFDELMRVLRPGGGCVLIEPHNGLASAFVHRHLHSDEHFDPHAPGWETPDIGGPLSGANQALAYIVFDRDRGRFEEKFGVRLEVVHRAYELNALRYLFSGGLNFRQLLPSFMAVPLGIIERLLAPFARHWTLHQAIVIRKRPCCASM